MCVEFNSIVVEYLHINITGLSNGLTPAHHQAITKPMLMLRYPKQCWFNGTRNRKKSMTFESQSISPNKMQVKIRL